MQHVPIDFGRLTWDGGLAWIAQVDTPLGLCAALAGQIPDWRRGPVQHPLETLVRNRPLSLDQINKEIEMRACGEARRPVIMIEEAVSFPWPVC